MERWQASEAVSVLKLGDYLVALAQPLLSDEGLSNLRDRVMEQVGRYRSRGVILDVSGLDVMDSYSARVVRDLAQMVRLRGAETVIVGIPPEVAFAMVQLGLRLEGVKTALDIEEGISCLDSKGDRRQSSLDE